MILSSSSHVVPGRAAAGRPRARDQALRRIEALGHHVAGAEQGRALDPVPTHPLAEPHSAMCRIGICARLRDLVVDAGVLELAPMDTQRASPGLLQRLRCADLTSITTAARSQSSSLRRPVERESRGSPDQQRCAGGMPALCCTMRLICAVIGAGHRTQLIPRSGPSLRKTMFPHLFRRIFRAASSVEAGLSPKVPHCTMQVRLCHEWDVVASAILPRSVSRSTSPRETAGRPLNLFVLCTASLPGPISRPRRSVERSTSRCRKVAPAVPRCCT